MKTIPVQLEPFIEARRARGKTTRDIVRFIVDATDVPLTALEVTNLAAQLNERVYDYNYITKILRELMADGLAISRIETNQERNIRANGRLVKGHNAALFIGTSTGRVAVPTRTVGIAVPGVALGQRSDGIAYRYTHKTKAGKKTRASTRVLVSGLPSKPKAMTGDVAELLEQLIATRTEKLQSKLDRIARILAE
jgi:hypothetical protein